MWVFTKQCSIVKQILIHLLPKESLETLGTGVEDKKGAPSFVRKDKYFKFQIKELY
jgi:hypothetical protein